MYRFVYSLRLLLWWLTVAMPLGAYAGDDTRSELVEVLTISEDISISSNHISKGVSDIVTLDKGLFRSQVAFDIISAYSTWQHPHSSDRIQTSGDIAVRFIGGKCSCYDASPQANIGDANKATLNPFVQGDVGTELLKLTPPLFNGDQGKQFLFRQDFEQDYNTLMRILDDGIPGGKVAAWETLIAHPLIRKDVATLTSASKILDNSGIANIISKTDLQTTVQKLAEKGVRCRTCASGNPAYRYMDEILDDLENGATKFGDEYTSVITGFKQGGNFTEGAMFVADAVKRYGDDFPPGTLFEFTEVTVGGVRRVDVRVGNTFYEFKSVASVPPSGFADQFVKDLNLGEVTQLDQLKWWFDVNKVSSLPKQHFLDALDNATVPQNIVDNLTAKFGGSSWDDIVDLIDNNFNNIFHVK